MDCCIIDSPVGLVSIKGNTDGIYSVLFSAKGIISSEIPESLTAYKKQLEEYFSGSRENFSLKLNISGTPFQIKVWKELQRIPYDTVITYSDLARRIGNAKAYRAVGNAVGANPLPIIIPCHRVVACNGIGGYSGELEIKQWLLLHEQKHLKKNTKDIKSG